MLPYLKSVKNKTQKQIVTFRGINYSDMFQDGDLREAKNISSRRFPYLTTRRARATVDVGGVTPIAMTEWDNKLILVYRSEVANEFGEYSAHISCGGETLKDESGNAYKLSDTDKQFAAVGNKIVIFPDKVYIDLSKDEETNEVKPTLKKMVHSFRYRLSFTQIKNSSTSEYYPAGQLKVIALTSGTNEENAPKSFKFSDYFKVGDALLFKETEIEALNNKRGTIVKLLGEGDTGSAVLVQFEEEMLGENGGALNESATASFETSVPELDFICEYNNRLYGCSNEEQTIYVSALGDPSQFYNGGTDAGSYAVAVGTDGKFTGCTALGSSVLFWKEDKLHKLLGSFPSEYTVYDYSIDGVQEGGHKSQVVINETLYYKGARGVYAFSGGIPSLISTGFGSRMFENGVAGTDGKNYYLSVDEGDASHLFVYDTESKLWMREDETRVKEFARVGNDLYFLANDSIWIADGGEEDANVEWEAQFTPFYETLQGRKTYSKILLRMELPKGNWVKAWTRSDGRRWVYNGNMVGEDKYPVGWRPSGSVVGKDYDTTTMRIPVNRCDKFEIKLTGKGQCTILAMLREFSVGSDV